MSFRFGGDREYFFWLFIVVGVLVFFILLVVLDLFGGIFVVFKFLGEVVFIWVVRLVFGEKWILVVFLVE